MLVRFSDETLLATVGNNWGGASWYSSTTAFNSGEHEKLIIRIDTLSDDYFCLDRLTLMAAGGIQCFDGKGIFRRSKCTFVNFAVATKRQITGKYSLKLNPGNGYSHLDMGFALLDNQQYWITLADYYIESGSLGYAVNYSKIQREWSKYTENALKRDTLKTQRLVADLQQPCMVIRR